jgi:hypothetical protein
MTLLAVIVFAVLVAIAALHATWGFGMRFPAKNERELVALAIGEKGRTEMPDLRQCLVAALAILAAGFVALLLIRMIRVPLPPGFVTLAGGFVATIFAARGIAGYLPFWRARFSQEPFGTLDRWAYSPLCFALSAAFVTLLISRLGA